ncbi:hypothetical protein [Porcincola intestinalis]|uniref:Uncharacterized protein n=1 Tax=Porcincola intestinalis TaxID=2606632 RepID=A0A6L5X340_9FIRM|nr:hypothetical protein [Porcincola intestinalis]MSS13783.1 hypothetical protein [Porcincola intestinalis]
MKLKREAMATFIDTAMNVSVGNVSKAVWEIVGDDIESMSVDMNADTDQKKNILGQTKTTDNGYKPSMEADPFYADPDKKLYPVLRDIAMERKKGDACKTLMMEVIVDSTEATTALAYVREVLIKPKSYGGDSSYLNIPYTVSEDGAWVKGTVTLASLKTGNPTFTAGTAGGGA